MPKPNLDRKPDSRRRRRRTLGLARPIRQGQWDPVRQRLAGMGRRKLAQAVLGLDQDLQTRLLAGLSVAEAAGVVEEVGPENLAYAAEELPRDRLAALLRALPTDLRDDLLHGLDEEAVGEVLGAMAPAEREQVRRLLACGADTAGGLMTLEYLALPGASTVQEALAEIRSRREELAAYDIQYVYVVDDEGRLEGVLRMRDLLFAPAHRTLTQQMLSDCVSVRLETPLDELLRVFARRRLLGVPVVDEQGRICGVLSRQAVAECVGRRTRRHFMERSGIVRGEEFRSMPLIARSRRRLSYLGVSILLNLVAVQVIAAYQGTLQAAIALAVFLPLIAHVSAGSGNQAIAVSMREMMLGLTAPGRLLTVLWKEAAVGLLDGLVLGAVVAGAIFLLYANAWLAGLVGFCLAVNSLLAVCLGGLLPLAMKRLGGDSALMSGPILVAATNASGFFLTLTLATWLLPHLAGG